MFWPFLLLFICYFNSVCHSVCYLFVIYFCRFNFVCYFFVMSILSATSIVIFLDHFLVTWVLVCRFGYNFCYFVHCKDDFFSKRYYFCRCSNKLFLLFPYSWQKRHQKIKRMTILQVAKHCIFWRVFLGQFLCHLRLVCNIFQYLYENRTKKNEKITTFSSYNKKKQQVTTHYNFTDCKNVIHVSKHGHFFVIFLSFSNKI